jgi:hypothetical protein
VGNFGWVFADVFERAYAPLVEALRRHPNVRVSLHYSGPLFDWIRAEQPEFVADLANLVARGQVELLGGGWYEPVLASLPERDRLGQLTRMADEIEGAFGARPRGAWLAERVWEPDLPTSLTGAGYSWTVLDDAHLRSASVADEAHWGAYTTEDQGRLLTIFGTEQGLRYLIPFHEVDEVIEYLREHATADGHRLGVMGDDGEKFGAWPGTWEHCWGENRWVERFFEALEANADWLNTVTPSDWLGDEPPVGRIYVPTGSYLEMTEWALPADETLAFAAALERARALGRPEAKWLRGGFWRNFQVKYREINDLHKQMLRTSARVAAMPPGPLRDQATDHLYAGQSNDCYWHGLFGGIYISHMRLATFEHLIAAQDAADATLGVETGVLRDLDMDGRPDVLLATEGQVVAIVPHEGAGIGSWDIRAARHALTAVMRRRPESYHVRLRQLGQAEAEESSDAEASETEASEAEAADTEGSEEALAAEAAPASIHELVSAKETGLAERLHFDAYERRSGLIHMLAPDTSPAAFADGEGHELLDAVDGPFEVERIEPQGAVFTRQTTAETIDGEVVPVRLRSVIRLSGGRLDPGLAIEARVTNEGQRPLEGRFGVELATTMLGGGGNPAAWWLIGTETSTHDVARGAQSIDALAAGNDYIGIRLDIRTSSSCDAWISPIETISNSEAGFERIYQGSALLISQVVRVEPGDTWMVGIDSRIRVARDRAVEETQAVVHSVATPRDSKRSVPIQASRRG